MIKILCIIIGLSFSQNLLGQKSTRFERYDLLKRQAMLNYVDGHYKNALVKFKAAFKIIPDDDVSDYFYAASAALHLQKDSVAKQLIIDAIVRTKASKNYFLNFKGFKKFRKLPLFEQIRGKYADYTAQFYAHLKHPKIYKEVDWLRAEDQRVRSTNVSNQEIRRVDSLNVARLIAITKKYGWYSRGMIILWHQRYASEKEKHNDFWSFFIPYINNQIKKGKIRKSFWAHFDDFMSIVQDKKQIYGIYWAQFDQFPVKNVKLVDQRRKKVGLAPIWYMHKVYGTDLPKGYVYPDTLSLQ